MKSGGAKIVLAVVFGCEDRDADNLPALSINPLRATARAFQQNRPGLRSRHQFIEVHHGNHRKPGQGTARAYRRRHDGMQEGADRKSGQHRRAGRMAAQAGPRQGRQEGQPRRRRRPHRDGAGRRQGRARRNQLRDRLRREGRELPRLRERRRQGSARLRREGRRGAQGGQAGVGRDGRGSARGSRRQGRRERAGASPRSRRHEQ